MPLDISGHPRAASVGTRHFPCWEWVDMGPLPLRVFDVLRISEALATVTAMVGEGKEITDWCRWAAPQIGRM